MDYNDFDYSENGLDKKAVKNVVYVINNNYEIVYYNKNIENIYPDLKCGDVCYKTMLGEDYPCKQCPLNESEKAEVKFYNSRLQKWVRTHGGTVMWPGEGECHVVTAVAADEKDLPPVYYIPFLTNYDLFFEINITKNTYTKNSRTKGLYENTKNMSLEEMLDDLRYRLIHPEDKDDFRRFWNLNSVMTRLRFSSGVLAKEFRQKSPDNTWHWIQTIVIPCPNQNGDEVVWCFLNDIQKDTEKVGQEWMKKQEPEKEYNPLTGLPTERYFKVLARSYIDKADKKSCIMAIDIENFRFFNKWYGRAMGDKLLVSISALLRDIDNELHTVSGYCGGDNFCILLPYNEEIIDLICAKVTEIVTGFEGTKGFKAAFGGYVIDDKMLQVSDMLDYATIALTRAIGRMDTKVCWYDAGLVAMLEEELRLMPEVVRGIEEKEFVFYVQPKFSLSKQRVVGAEALVRWKHKKRGMIPPGQFIPVLEKNGYISKLDAYLWEQVAIQLREWIDKGYEPVPISVNVSRLDFYAMDVPEFFGNLVKKYRLDPKYIEIEITENSYVEDAEVIKRAENDFKHNGFSVLIDDFGSGYSSLNMLKDIHADILKLDMKFLDLNEQNLAKGEEIIKSVFDLSHSLRMPVIAEGVETGDQVSMLGQMGCDLIQGYYFYRPLPVGEFEELMKNEEKTAAAIPVKTAVNAVMARKINTVSSYFIKTAEVNLLTGEYQLINTLDTDDKFIADNTNTIAEYVKERQKYNIVHPDDGDCYFKCSDTKYILDQISDGKRRLHSKMRYFFEGEYRNALFEVTIPPEYSDENPWVLYSWKLIYDD